MRVLFASVSEKSHILTMAPLAWALTNAGHEVRMASAPAMTDVITGAGVTAVPVGTDHSLHEALASEETVEHPLADWSDPFVEAQDWATLLLKYQVAVGYAFQPYNDTIVDDLVALARSWQPDLVVWDPITFAGGVAARAVGAAHARLTWCVDVYSAMRRVFHELAAQQPDDQRSDPMADASLPDMRARSRPGTAIAAMMPMTAPAAARIAPSRTNSRRMAPAENPIDARMPTSVVRCSSPTAKNR